MERSSALLNSWKNFTDIKTIFLRASKKLMCDNCKVYSVFWLKLRAITCPSSNYSRDIRKLFLVSALLWKVLIRLTLHCISLHCSLNIFLHLQLTALAELFYSNLIQQRKFSKVSSYYPRFSFLFSVNIHYQVFLVLW